MKWKILRLCLCLSLLPHTLQAALSSVCLPGVLAFCSHRDSQRLLPLTRHQAFNHKSLSGKSAPFPGCHGILLQSCFLILFCLEDQNKYRNKSVVASPIISGQRDKQWIWLRDTFFIPFTSLHHNLRAFRTITCDSTFLCLYIQKYQ